MTSPSPCVYNYAVSCSPPPTHFITPPPSHPPTPVVVTTMASPPPHVPPLPFTGSDQIVGGSAIGACLIVAGVGAFLLGKRKPKTPRRH